MSHPMARKRAATPGGAYSADAARPMFAILAELERERVRQVAVKGYTPQSDDGYVEGDLARAACVYAGLDLPAPRPEGFIEWLLEMWPWTGHEPASKGHRANLVRAGALIVAEIERIDRAEQPI